MSEYQYYEFLSIDRALVPRQMRELRAVSSRAEISPTRFTNSYDYGDFKGDPSRWMDRYFDAFLYFANWGTRAVSLRVPREFLDLRTARTYCRTRSASARVSGRWLVLDFVSDREDGEYEGLEDPSGELGAIAPARDEVLAGDLRLLYLGWLLSVQAGEADEGSPPPCPPGMGALSGPLSAFAEFMGLPAGLLARAAERSRPASADRVAFVRWASALPQRRLASWLERLVFPRGPHARAEVLRELRNRAELPRETSRRRRASRTARETAARPRR
jgi:hypothetical protein